MRGSFKNPMKCSWSCVWIYFVRKYCNIKDIWFESTKTFVWLEKFWGVFKAILLFKIRIACFWRASSFLKFILFLLPHDMSVYSGDSLDAWASSYCCMQYVEKHWAVNWKRRRNLNDDRIQYRFPIWWRSRGNIFFDRVRFLRWITWRYISGYFIIIWYANWRI